MPLSKINARTRGYFFSECRTEAHARPILEMLRIGARVALQVEQLPQETEDHFKAIFGEVYSKPK